MSALRVAVLLQIRALATKMVDLYVHAMALCYKLRWQIEVFFRWIKQHLRFNRFYSNCVNAVESQIVFAVSVY